MRLIYPISQGLIAQSENLTPKGYQWVPRQE
jgi:hypothetical protein